MSPTKAPRLAEVRPAEVARDVVDLVARQLSRLAFAVSANVSEVKGATSLDLSTALLVEWTQTGTNGERWNAVAALDAVQAVCEALYSCAGEPGSFGAGPLEEAIRDSDADQPIGIVLRAAWARIHLAHGEGVRGRDLAALAGITRAYVSEETGSGRLRVHDGLVTAESASRWLGARGVRGIGRK